MFPRERRLRRHRDIQRLLKTGRRLSTPELMLRYLPNGRTKPRVTVVVGTAVSKRAVVRNRLKRQIRHLLMAELKDRPAGFDLMVSTRANAVKMAAEARSRSVHDLLRRARII